IVLNRISNRLPPIGRVQTHSIQGLSGFGLSVTCSRNRDQVRDAPSLTFDIAVVLQTATSRAWDIAHLDPLPTPLFGAFSRCNRDHRVSVRNVLCLQTLQFFGATKSPFDA